jgi:hypothetical protein
MLSMKRPLKALSGSFAEDFLTPEKRTRFSWATASTSFSRLLIALWLVEVTPTRLPRRMSSTMRCEPVKVLPAPGGPWMKR